MEEEVDKNCVEFFCFFFRKTKLKVLIPSAPVSKNNNCQFVPLSSLLEIQKEKLERKGKEVISLSLIFSFVATRRRKKKSKKCHLLLPFPFPSPSSTCPAAGKRPRPSPSAPSGPRRARRAAALLPFRFRFRFCSPSRLPLLRRRRR